MHFFLRVAIDTPLRRVFDYLPPAKIEPQALQAGQRVWVPFGRRRSIGWILAVSTHSAVADNKLKRAFSVVDTEPVFNAELLALLLWSAEYYHYPIGMVLAAALPQPLRQGVALQAQHEVWRLTAQGVRDAPQVVSPRATRLQAVLQLLTDQWQAAAVLQQTHPHWRAVLRTLERRGFVERTHITAPSQCVSAATADIAPILNLDQQRATQHITHCLGAFHTVLLHGVTGSGKTEVYLQAITAVLARDEQALVLAPEIALTPQLVARFSARFGAMVVVLHSALSEAERLAAWRAIRQGAARIVIGTRSAVFAPLIRLGLIVVDEEHDTAYKQQEGFRYSARDLAIVRAQRLNIPVVLGSATPSLESLLRTERQPNNLLTLPQRAGAAQAPQLRLVDLRQHACQQGLSTPVMLAIRQHLDQAGQVLLYLNRRGYAPVWFCPQCAWTAMCARCDAHLTVHGKQRLLCHHCGHETALNTQCPECAAVTKPVGQGTERIEETLQQLYPDAPLARIDRDSVSRKGALAATLARVHSGDAKILVGTQMLSKGHDFPGVTLAVILNADQGLFSTDFRGSERLMQSITQVAGRAGRATRPGEVLIQTEFPQHPLLQCLLAGGYTAFVTAALQERKQADWPPYARLALLRVEATQPAVAQQFLQTVCTQMRPYINKVKLLGPAPAPMGRRAGLYRAQLLLHAATHGPLQRCLTHLMGVLESKEGARRVRWSLDVDPVELF